jgi:hypothetical protein
MPDPIPFPGATPTLPPEALLPPPDAAERVAMAERRQADAALLQALTLPSVRPRDFTARIRRRDMTSWRHQHRAPSRLAERSAGIAAIGAIGVVLGAIGWGSPGIDAAAAHDRDGALQPFERAGKAFPARRSIMFPRRTAAWSRPTMPRGPGTARSPQSAAMPTTHPALPHGAAIRRRARCLPPAAGKTAGARCNA